MKGYTKHKELNSDIECYTGYRKEHAMPFHEYVLPKIIDEDYEYYIYNELDSKFRVKWIISKKHIKISKVIESEFIQLAINWKKETAGYSTMYHKTINNNYLGIIGMGMDVVPFILNDLKISPDHWFIALKAITKKNPVPKEDIGNIKKMTEAWLQWGKENFYIQ